MYTITRGLKTRRTVLLFWLLNASLSYSLSLSLCSMFLVVRHQVVRFQDGLLALCHFRLSSRPGILMQNPFRYRFIDAFRRFAD